MVWFIEKGMVFIGMSKACISAYDKGTRKITASFLGLQLKARSQFALLDKLNLNFSSASYDEGA